MGWLRGWLSGGSNEIGFDDLIEAIASAIAGRRQFGRRGETVFPAQLRIEVVAPGEGLQVVRGFVEDPDLDRRIQAALANRCDCEPAALPLCTYTATAGERFEVHIDERAQIAAWHIEVVGGDRGGTRLELPGQRELHFGRGQWHGPEAQLRNDLVVSDADTFVSRRAGRLLRVGHTFEVESLDQGDFLTVHRHDGSPLRPARCARGRVTLRSGDEIELSSGAGESVRLAFHRSTG